MDTRTDFFFPALSLLVGVSPAHELENPADTSFDLEPLVYKSLKKKIPELRDAIDGYITPEQAGKHTRTDFFFPALSLLVGVSPAHEHKCFAEGKASILVPISEIIPMAVKVLLIPGAVWSIIPYVEEWRKL